MSSIRPLMPLIFCAYLCTVAALIAGFTKTWVAAVPLAVVLGWLCTTQPMSTRCACAALALSAWCLAFTSRAPQRFTSDRPDPRTWLGGQRLRADSAITRVFRADAPVAKALLIANQHEIDPSIKRRYADAGIIHMLSISGLHVAIVAGAIELLAMVARLPIRSARLSALAVTAGYVALIGFPAPAVRSGMMLGVTSVTSLLQRPVSRWTSLALGAFPPLLVPTTALDVGYQLSVLGIAGLVASGALARKWITPHVSGWRQSLARGLLASTVATLVSAPLVVAAFGRLSLIAPFTNLVADPILTLAQPMLFAALLLTPWISAARFVADAVHPLLQAFDTVATIGASMPHAALAVSPPPSTLVLSAIASAAMIVACISRFPMRATLVSASALCAILWV